MNIKIPKLSLVVLIGPSGSGKSVFARRHFKPTEIISSDACRGMVSDDENDQTVTNQAFELLRFVAGKRLALGRLTVIDATNVQPEARKPLVELARQYHCLPVAIVLDLPEKLCLERNSQRADREFGPHVVRNQKSQLRRSLRGLQREGFRHVFVLESPEEVETIRSALTEAGKKFELHVYPDEGHAFFRRGVNGDSSPASRDVWPKVAAFLNQNLDDGEPQDLWDNPR